MTEIKIILKDIESNTDKYIELTENIKIKIESRVSLEIKHYNIIIEDFVNDIFIGKLCLIENDDVYNISLKNINKIINAYNINIELI